MNNSDKKEKNITEGFNRLTILRRKEQLYE